MHVQYTIPRVGLPAATSIRRWASATLEQSAEATVRLVDEHEGRMLNRSYRGRNYATNVLTFAYGLQDGALMGDIVLCAPVVAREATEQCKPLRLHYAHLVVHGMLHLQGYDHERASEARKMEAKEIAILAQLGFDNPYEDGYRSHA